MDPQKERFAKYIRAAAIYEKEGRLSEALIYVEHALRLFPKEYHARSLFERLSKAIAKRDENRYSMQAAEAEIVDSKLELVSQLLRNAEQFIQTKEYQRALKEIAKVYAIDPNNHFAQAYSAQIESLMDAEKSGEKPAQAAGWAPPPPPVTAEVPQTPAPPPPAEVVSHPVEAPPKELPKDEKGTIAMYRELLKEMWFDGKLSDEEVAHLKKVRESFGITEDDHQELEKQVHVESYVDALRVAWREGKLSDTNRDVLALLRERYGITIEEHLSAEAEILWAKSGGDKNVRILVADDEKTLLLALAARLKKFGYEVATAESVEKAIPLAEEFRPALILSDLKFGEGAMTGLDFYQAVRTNPNVKDTPFLLMSGISDEFVIRAGIRMGVDSFLKKPFDLNYLIATIEGKLKGE